MAQLQATYSAGVSREETAMWGRGKWVPAEATVVDRRMYSASTGKGVMIPKYEFILDVRLADSEVFRSTVRQPRGQYGSNLFIPPEVNEVVAVKVESKTRKVRFDWFDNPTRNIKLSLKIRDQQFDALSKSEPAAD
jgi:hypothetical protein